MITSSTTLTFSVEDLNIRARLAAPNRVRFDWEGNFSMRKPPEGLLDFLLGASEKNSEKIEQNHTEGLHNSNAQRRFNRNPSRFPNPSNKRLL